MTAYAALETEMVQETGPEKSEKDKFTVIPYFKTADRRISLEAAALAK